MHVLLALASVLSTTVSQIRSDPVPSAPVEVIGPTIRFGDYDRDGLPDAYVVNLLVGDRLLRNVGDGTFTDVTDESGLSGIHGSCLALWQDYDGDGALDLFICNSDGPSRLMRNEGNGGFSDATRSSGIAHASQRDLFAEWLDYDANGLQDLHVVADTGDRLYRNCGGGSFELVNLASHPTRVDRIVVPAEAPDAASQRAADVVDVTRPEVTSAGATRKSTPSRGNRGPRSAEDRSASANATVNPIGPHGSALPVLNCVDSLQDQSPGACLVANSTPTLGQLYPISAKLFVNATTGFVGINDTTPTARLDVTETSTATLATVRADGASGPTRGYLGAQGRTDFDGVGTADWPGLEIGVAGISTDATSTDNYGVLGHSNGVGVRGEYFGVPGLSSYGELGQTGVGVRGSGTVAGDFLGGVHIDGDLSVFGPGSARTVLLEGGLTSGSVLSLYDVNASSNPKISIEIDTREGATGGAIRMYNGVEGGTHPNQATVEIQAGEADNNPRFVLYDDQGGIAVEIDAKKTDGLSRVTTDVLQITGGMDLSERFHVGAQDDPVQPGMVVSIDADVAGALVVSRTPYDRRVAGIVSGAGGIGTGVVLGQEGSPMSGAQPVALSGRVYCWADASTGSIEAGDLLTSSATPGHAMKATDEARSRGAILGKAMTSLARGKGLVLVLVGLQ